jgi:hypothetical protein
MNSTSSLPLNVSQKSSVPVGNSSSAKQNTEASGVVESFEEYLVGSESPKQEIMGEPPAQLAEGGQEEASDTAKEESDPVEQLVIGMEAGVPIYAPLPIIPMITEVKIQGSEEALQTKESVPVLDLETLEDVPPAPEEAVEVITNANQLISNEKGQKLLVKDSPFH